MTVISTNFLGAKTNNFVGKKEYVKIFCFHSKENILHKCNKKTNLQTKNKITDFKKKNKFPDQLVTLLTCWQL